MRLPVLKVLEAAFFWAQLESYLKAPQPSCYILEQFSTIWIYNMAENSNFVILSSFNSKCEILL